MKEANKSADMICKAVWTVFHKASADGKKKEIIVGYGENLEITILSIPTGKATSATIETIERKISEAFQKLQSESKSEQENPWELRVGINENTGAQEVYLFSNNGDRQLVVSNDDFEE